ncbi:MAG TPA: hypothetical protein VMA98_13255 [Candidatus Acidoferrales bacterium]|nr:hypothetical protein [Candidatus Acidoferrales bacterium]
MLHLVMAALIHADVLISAGHEGRPASCARYPHRACNLGAAGERAWTPIVADEATRVLRAHGVRVLREPADFDGRYAVGAAVFIHFDGAVPACSSGTSIGYHGPASARLARAWRAFYGPLFPFRFMPDDFTTGLRDYYAFRQVDARDGALVLELGEITCPSQHAWLATRLLALGDAIAFFLSRELGKGDVPYPAKFVTNR